MSSGWSCSVRRTLAPVPIVEAHDVVLTEVRARLNLDMVKRNHAGILDPVLHPDGNVGGLIFLQQENFLPASNARRPGDDYPVLRTMMVHLQRQGCTGFDLEALHLEALTIL